MRIAVSGGRIGNLVPAERPGERSRVSRAVSLTRGLALQSYDGGFLLPEGGVQVGEVLFFQRDARSLKATVTRIEDEHLFEVETDAEAAARTAEEAKQAAAEADAAVASGGAGGKEG